MSDWVNVDFGDSGFGDSSIGDFAEVDFSDHDFGYGDGLGDGGPDDWLDDNNIPQDTDIPTKDEWDEVTRDDWKDSDRDGNESKTDDSRGDFDNESESKNGDLEDGTGSGGQDESDDSETLTESITGKDILKFLDTIVKTIPKVISVVKGKPVVFDDSIFNEIKVSVPIRGKATGKNPSSKREPETIEMMVLDEVEAAIRGQDK